MNSSSKRSKQASKINHKILVKIPEQTGLHLECYWSIRVTVRGAERRCSDHLFTCESRKGTRRGRKWHLKRKEETSMQQRQGRQQQQHAVSWASDSWAGLSVASSRASFPVSLAHHRRWHGTVPQKCLLQSALWYRVHINKSCNKTEPVTHHRD